MPEGYRGQGRQRTWNLHRVRSVFSEDTILITRYYEKLILLRAQPQQLDLIFFVQALDQAPRRGEKSPHLACHIFRTLYTALLFAVRVVIRRCLGRGREGAIRVYRRRARDQARGTHDGPVLARQNQSTLNSWLLADANKVRKRFFGLY